MKFEDVRRRVVLGIPDTAKSLFDDPMLSDAMYKAIRDMQENSKCSRIKVRKTLPSNSYTITAGTKSSGVVTLTLNARHNMDEFTPFTVDVPDANYDGTFSVSEVPAYNQIKYVFGSNTPAAISSGSVEIGELFSCFINPEYHGIDFLRDTAATDDQKKNKFNVETLNLDMVWEVLSDGTLDPFIVIDPKQIQYYKDDSEWRALVSEDFFVKRGSVEFDRHQIRLESPSDIRGKTFEFWLRFGIPYIQDAHTTTTSNGATLMDSMIETIPLRFHERLINPIKYEVYCALNERSEGKYKEILKELLNKKTIDMDFVRAEASGSPSFSRIKAVRPKSVFTEWAR